MKQIQFTYTNDVRLDTELRKVRQWYNSSMSPTMLFQIYTEELDHKRVSHLCNKIRFLLPEALYAGCSSNGNILHGDFSGGSIMVVCTLFEYPSTKVEVFQYHLTEDTMRSVSRQIISEVEKRDWVKAVELLTTIRHMSMTPLCEELSALREDISIFGGGAFSEDIQANEACVFSSSGSYQEQSIAVILIGGDDFHVRTSFITGWKPLGVKLNVTSTDGPVLKELNHRPAYDIYYRYLRIRNDENFFYNTLEFPFIYPYNGIELMRAPTASLPDGSLVMTSDMSQDVQARIAYGDPWTILNAVYDEANVLLNFVPECIMVFSCAARRTFWGNQEVGKETLPYEEVAPTSGFYTSGEFLRTGKYVNQHNVTQVIAAMREGEPGQRAADSISMADQLMEGKVSMINRMAAFIKATTDELEEANRKLSQMAITDGLTGLLNRREIQNRICEEIDVHKNPDVFLLMLDIDDFKQVNDTYGHQEGDRVLSGLAAILREVTEGLGETACAGRWGGEEFMIMLPQHTQEDAVSAANLIREKLSNTHFDLAGTVTVSIGVTRTHGGENSDIVSGRVDKALYTAKDEGKDRIIFL